MTRYKIRREVSVYLPTELVEEIDSLCGDIIPRSKMVERLLRLGLQAEWRLPVHQPIEEQKQGGEG